MIGSDRNSGTPVAIMPASAAIIQGRPRAHISYALAAAQAEPQQPHVDDQHRAAEQRRVNEQVHGSITGNSQFEPTTNCPSQSDSHH